MLTQRLPTASRFINGTVAIAGDLTSVKAALDRSSGVNSISPALAAQVQALSTSQDAWSISLASLSALIPGGAAQGAGGPTPGTATQALQLVKNIQSCSAGLKFGANVQFTAQAVADTPQDASALGDVIKMVASLAAMSGGTNKDAAAFAQLLQSLQVTTSGATVNLSASVPESQIEALLNSALTPHEKIAKVPRYSWRPKMQMRDVFSSKRVRILLYAAAATLVTLGVIATVLVLRFQPIARDYLISAIRERYNSEVEMGDLHISFFPAVHAVGQNLVLRFGGRHDLPPMIRVRQFTLDAQLANFFRNPKRISRLRLEGLEIQTPPRSAGGAAMHSAGAPGDSSPKFVLDEVIADSAVLSTMPSDPTKDPLVFQLRELNMRSVGIGQPMTFHVKLENAKPPGLIHSDGQFGPWNSTQPSDTPVSGNYTFRDADLGVFKGIAGTLSSDGQV